MFIYLTHVQYTFSCISAYIKIFRYCEYLGKYFCQCCHRNEINYIPGHIIRKWDFKQYPVSNFSWRLLSRIFNEPYFNLSTINPSLFKRVKLLILNTTHGIKYSYLHVNQSNYVTCMYLQRMTSVWVFIVWSAFMLTSTFICNTAGDCLYSVIPSYRN